MYGTYQRLNVSVYASDMEVIRRARLKIAKKHRSVPAKREARKLFYREMLAYHAQARKLVQEFRL